MLFCLSLFELVGPWHFRVECGSEYRCKGCIDAVEDGHSRGVHVVYRTVDRTSQRFNQNGFLVLHKVFCYGGFVMYYIG
jgi:hypothetical protein